MQGACRLQTSDHNRRKPHCRRERTPFAVSDCAGQALLALKDAVSDKGQSKLGSWRAEGELEPLMTILPPAGCAAPRLA